MHFNTSPQRDDGDIDHNPKQRTQTLVSKAPKDIGSIRDTIDGNAYDYRTETRIVSARIRIL